MALETWMLFLFAAIGLSMTPGPSGLLALTHGSMHGLRKSIFTLLGGCVGFALVIAVSMAGMGALLMASYEAFLVAKIIGAAYLVYLGVKVFRSPPMKVDETISSPRSGGHWKMFAEGFLVAASNPKAIIFFAAFLPQFVDASQPQLPQFFAMALTFVTVEFIYELAVAGFAHKLKPLFAEGTFGIWFNRVTGATFVGIGGFLATMSRS
ncbi:MAG: LysE family translocator [Alphaproteobacteria bacterium]|nr:LysE family translocator [Alphaproteobacteria bacterium]